MPTLAIIDGIKITMYYADHERRTSMPSPDLGAAASGGAGPVLGALQGRAETGKDRELMLRTIQSAEPLSPSRIRLVWGDGTESVVDLAPVLAKGGVFAHLTDPAAFRAVAVGPRGRTLIWRGPEGDEIDLCADALWRLAHRGTIEAA